MDWFSKKYPYGYSKNSETMRCYEHCIAGYFNEGEACLKPENWLGMEEMVCELEEIRIESKCFGIGGTEEACLSAQGESSNGLCYPPCERGFHGIGPDCWKICEAGWKRCGTSCQKTLGACTRTNPNADGVPSLISGYWETLGLSDREHDSDIISSSIGGETVSANTEVGGAFIAAVKTLQRVQSAGSKNGSSVIQRMFSSKTGINSMQRVRRLNVDATAFSTEVSSYTKAFADDFIDQTSPNINALLDDHFFSRTAYYLKRAWAMWQLAEICSMKGWDISDSALFATSLLITNKDATDTAPPKPLCQIRDRIPCIRSSIHYHISWLNGQAYCD